MTLNQLYYFRVIAALSNFRKAAEVLCVSQPTLSVSMSSLEEELGIKLFERVGRHVELTKYGLMFQKQIETILSLLDKSTTQMKRMASVSGGHVDLGYISPVTRWLPRIVRMFLNEKDNADITFNFGEGTTNAVMDGLASGKYDIVFHPLPITDSDIISIPALQQELVGIVPLGHPLAEKDEIDLIELSPYPLVAYMQASGLKKRIDEYIGSVGWEPDVVCEASDEDGIAALVGSNFGVSFVAKVDTLDFFDIKQLHIKNPSCSRTIYMAYLKNQYKTPATLRFIKFMRDIIPTIASI